LLAGRKVTGLSIAFVANIIFNKISIPFVPYNEEIDRMLIACEMSSKTVFVLYKYLVGQEDLGRLSGRHMELGVGFLQRYFLPFAKEKFNK